MPADSDAQSAVPTTVSSSRRTEALPGITWRPGTSVGRRHRPRCGSSAPSPAPKSSRRFAFSPSVVWTPYRPGRGRTRCSYCPGMSRPWCLPRPLVLPVERHGQPVGHADAALRARRPSHEVRQKVVRHRLPAACPAGGSRPRARDEQHVGRKVPRDRVAVEGRHRHVLVREGDHGDGGLGARPVEVDGRPSSTWRLPLGMPEALSRSAIDANRAGAPSNRQCVVRRDKRCTAGRRGDETGLGSRRSSAGAAGDAGVIGRAKGQAQEARWAGSAAASRGSLRARGCLGTLTPIHCDVLYTSAPRDQETS